MEEIINYISYKIRDEILQYRFKEVEEIRLRVGRPIALKIGKSIETINHYITTEEILETFEKICENSVYSYKKQICEGFITVRGGHRVGITGNCVFENGQVQNISYISSLNFRIAREKKGCADNLFSKVFNYEKNTIYNTLIVSEPGAGKTTMLRDLIRQISNSGLTCGLVDERNEISAMYKGIPQKDIGIFTDVISNVSKSKGMSMLVRSMAPEIIACDEIGSKEDIEAIKYAICSGVKGVFTVHGNNLDEIMKNIYIKDLFEKNIIDVVVVLDNLNKGKIKLFFKTPYFL